MYVFQMWKASGIEDFQTTSRKSSPMSPFHNRSERFGKFLCQIFFFQAEDGIRDVAPSRGLGDVYKRQQTTNR